MRCCCLQGVSLEQTLAGVRGELHCSEAVRRADTFVPDLAVAPDEVSRDRTRLYWALPTA